jgi:glycosyltransferase involved in cell wall biosynthesis
LGRAAAIVTPSAYLAHIFKGYSELAGRIRVISNILDIEAYPYRHRSSITPRLLWMRTFHEWYHPEMAIEVLVNLRRSHPSATLTMGGQEKGLGPAVRALAERRGLADAVRFPGFLGPADKQREFAAHDIFLNTNRVDNMPVSVLEAAAFGLPVVATAVGGVPYLLRDGETGLLVPDGDAAAMSDAVRRLLDQPGLAGRLSANGRRLAESCAWEPVRAQWQILFAEVLGHA